MVLSVILKTQVHVRVNFKWLQSTEKKKVCVGLVLHIRKGVGRREMLRHVLPFIFLFIQPACCLCAFLVDWL